MDDIYITESNSNSDDSTDLSEVISRLNRIESMSRGEQGSKTISVEQRLLESIELLNQRFERIEKFLLPPKKLHNPQRALGPLKQAIDALNGCLNGQVRIDLGILHDGLIKVYNEFCAYSKYDID